MTPKVVREDFSEQDSEKGNVKERQKCRPKTKPHLVYSRNVIKLNKQS